MDNGIANTNPVPENYEKFVNLVRRSSNKNIPRGCRTSYVCGLNDQSKDMYEDYQRRFAEDPFNEDTARVGDALLEEISEAQCSKWKEMIEPTNFTHSIRKAWKTINNQQTNKTLHKTSATMESHCRPSGSPTTSKWQREQTACPTKREDAKTNCHRVKTNVTILMEDLLHGVKALKTTKQQA